MLHEIKATPSTSSIIGTEKQEQNEKKTSSGELGEYINSVMIDFVKSTIDKNDQLIIDIMTADGFEPDDYKSLLASDNEKYIKEASRKGLCGECSDKSLELLNKKGINTFDKVNPSTEHYFLFNESNREIIEPTYKQMFFDSTLSLEDVKNRKELLSQYPDVFHGPKLDFDNLIDDICEKTNSCKATLHNNWRV